MNMTDALSKYRTVRAVARALDVRENTVSEWKTLGIPHPQQVKLESITGGELRADDEAWSPAEPRFSTERFNNGRHKPMPIRAKESHE
jgi:hypothetical protein